MRIKPDTVTKWREAAATFLATRGYVPDDVKTGVDAWTVAHQAGICRQAYEDRAITDGHIQTALERIFPNAAFKDRKAY